MKYVVTTVIILTLTMAVFAKAKDKGPIQTTIAAPAEIVKAVAVARAIKDGYTIASEWQYQVVFSRNASMGHSMLVQAFASPAACGAFPVRNLLTLVFAPASPLTVVGRYEIEFPSALCQPVREEVKGGKAEKQMEQLLADIKADAEKAATSAQRPQAEAPKQ